MVEKSLCTLYTVYIATITDIAMNPRTITTRLAAGLLGVTQLLTPGFAADIGTAAIRVHRPINCDGGGCMQDVAMLDDVTLALLTNAPDSDAADSVNFVRSIKPELERGWNENTPRIAVLGIAGFNSQPVRTIVTARRADTLKFNKFLIPIMKIDAAIDDAGKGVQLHPIVNDDRVRVNATYTDVCSTSNTRQYCVRIENIGKANSPAAIFAAAGLSSNMIAVFESHAPSPGSSDFNKMLLSLEVEVIDRKPIAVDGARIIRVRATRMVVHNLDVILSVKLG
jgi:hypothetical protein